MEERITISLLLDFYSELLTSKQKSIMNLYYNEDLSLAEISEHTKTTRQAIYDIIKRCNNTLFNYESKLKLMSKSKSIRKTKEVLLNYIDRLDVNLKNKEYREIHDTLDNMKKEIIENL